MKKTKDPKKTAFVLMPFKHKRDNDHDIYRSAFEDGIKPLLEEIGYLVFKEDDGTQHRSINKESATQLLKADLVVVDLASLNPNSYYKLDIRFKINRKPTILLIDEDSRDDVSLIDLSLYPTISYRPNEVSSETFVNELLAIISELNFPFNKIYGELEPAEKVSKALIDAHRDLDPDPILSSAENAVSDNNLQEFIELVQQFITLDSFMPIDSEFAQLYFLSNKIKKRSIVSKAILDMGLEAFPQSDKLLNLYVSHLSTSPDQKERNEAKKIVRDKLKIKIVKKEIQVEAVNTLDDIHLIAYMLDAYHYDGQHEEALNITSSLLQRFDDNAVVLRNHARALEKTRSETVETILETYQRAMFCLSVNDITARWYALTLNENKRLVDATEALLFACLLDLDDAANFSTLARVISDLLEPSNPIMVEKLQKQRKIPDEIRDPAVILEAIILSESCNNYTAEQRFKNEQSLKNIGISKDSLHDYYNNKYKGGDISRRDRSIFASELYSHIKTEITSEELYNQKKEKLA